ncbi:hypothetical protein Molly5_38 [Maribacter phage Molly_5]|uniref:Uncharacterized protein n=1 Tax=Maribacter phage Molly_1 TaxID=2745685 RepID=A0A8E4UYE1_9CAUD|nr:hypothetical protein M1M29_gp038 [Maribacter phage Molly_1]QQO97720.1 hypothetical protein Molly2_38 [Maribacter phage Molly_2]QQO97920.1 hypothetical protein Molly3_38 [Maribacter phage Molly_3]QQO98120.1 hypothetical protein Molly4_38 [Maribacter phage Molly_4]QQO98320.1 hypothetical protein Molly5_38 [Maribacter phage Molly_5]QQO97520.1 hypothetical protein Molly1_38 [Maribacter phage Molly_1]
MVDKITLIVNHLNLILLGSTPKIINDGHEMEVSGVVRQPDGTWNALVFLDPLADPKMMHQIPITEEIKIVAKSLGRTKTEKIINGLTIAEELTQPFDRKSPQYSEIFVMLDYNPLALPFFMLKVLIDHNFDVLHLDKYGLLVDEE